MTHHDPATGRRAEVERLLQVLVVLREGAGSWVPRARLTQQVTEYRGPRAPGALEKMVERDLETLRRMGFELTSETCLGEPARDRLGTSRWRLPLDLTTAERTLLSWVTAAAVADGAPPGSSTLLASGVVADLPGRGTLAAVTDLVGAPPSSIDLVHWALAGRRALVLREDGLEKVAHPVQLVARGTKWFLLLRYPGRDTCYGYRLERLDVVRLGDRIARPEPVADVHQVLSPLSWAKDAPTVVEIGCARTDLGRVRRDFPGFQVHVQGDDARLTGTTTHVAALVDLVIGQAGRAVVLGPPHVAARVVTAALAVGA